MESLFFQLESRRFRRRTVRGISSESFERIDVSSGVVLFRLGARRAALYRLSHHDRMVLLPFGLRGGGRIGGEGSGVSIREGEALLFVPEIPELRFDLEAGSDLCVVAVADFHLKRYLRGAGEDAVDYLYGILRTERRERMLRRQPSDALSLHLLERIFLVTEATPMAGLRAELWVGELLLHQFGFLELPREGVDEEDRQLALRAGRILAEHLADPPTIPELARRCATNDFRLKKLFKRVYGLTIYGYVQKLRMEEANRLLRREGLSVGDVARRVGYRHQGHFSRLFHRHYGLYPKELLGKSVS